MAHVIPSFTWETTTTPGTGSISLDGAARNYSRTFANGVGDQNECEYAIVSDTDFERGKGTVFTGSPDTLSRDVIRASSNSGNKVSFSTNKKDVFVVFTDEYVRNVSIPAVAFTQNSDVDHDSTTNFVSNEHVDHTWIVKSSAYTASAFDRILADTSVSSFTVTLPSNPSTGDIVWFADSGRNWDKSALTIDGNGNSILGETDLLANNRDAAFALVYNGTQWVLGVN